VSGRATRSAYEAHLVAMYDRDLAKHQLLRSSEREWLVGRPKDCFFLAAVHVALNSIVIHGDVPAVGFFGGPKDPRQKVQWGAGGPLDYLRSKASMFFGSDTLSFDDDHDIARSDLLWARRHRYISRDAARATATLIRHGDLDDARRTLYEYAPNYEDCGQLGTVVSARVVMGYCVLRKLDALLDEVHPVREDARA